MEYLKLYTLANNQTVIATNHERRFYSYDTCICVYDYDTKEFTLSENESHFTKTTVKWLNRPGHQENCYKEKSKLTP